MESWRANGSPNDLTPLVADKLVERKHTGTAHEDGLNGERAAREAVASLLRWAGQDPNRDDLRDTPRRVVAALREMTSGYHQEPARILSTTFPVDYREIVVLRHIHFTSLCEHHLMPFAGTCSLGYIPAGQVVGLSKLARLVSCFAHRLQIQERMTTEIADALWEHLRPRGVFLHLLSGLLSIVIGVLFLRAPVDALLALTLLLACLLMVGGLFKIIAALSYRFAAWGWPLVSGIIDLILGVMIWQQWPASALWVIGLFVGISLVFRGFNWIGLGLALRTLPPSEAL